MASLRSLLTVVFWTLACLGTLWAAPVLPLGVSWKDYDERTTATLFLETSAILAAAAVLLLERRARSPNEQLHRLAFYDQLTALPNRALFYDRLGHAMEQGRRRGQAIALLYLDVDHFKAVNDGHGHLVGDQVLVTLADRLQRATRPGDTVARLGGDEFVVLLEAPSGADEPEYVAERILEELSPPFRCAGRDILVSASIGITSARGLSIPIDPDDLLKDADAAMYQAKADGRGRYVSFEVSSAAA